MRNLLTKQEHRWFYFIEKLTNNRDWMILADLSALLDCSKRILKMDIRYLNENFDDFIIHTSNKGTKIEYNPNRSFKTFCQKLLMISDSYRLLEMIFLNENIKVKDISKHLDISLSTLYRMIDQLNSKTEDEFGFIIETGPCRLAGDENRIRLFFYTYFLEKYQPNNWPFDEDEMKTIHDLVQEIIQIKKLPYDFVYFNIVKIIALVNYTRFKNGHTSSIEATEDSLTTLLVNIAKENGLHDKIENTFNRPFNHEFILQILHPLIHPDIYQTHLEFNNALTKDNELVQKVEALKDILITIAEKHNLSIPNLEMLLFVVYSAASLEFTQPQSRHILYDQNGVFTKKIKNKFPFFYQNLRDGMEAYRAIMGKPITDDGINFYMFMVISWWGNLIAQLHQGIYKIRVLLVSDRHQKHAQMMKEFIRFEFGEQLNIEMTNSIYLDSEIADLSDYDLIISSYFDNRLTAYRSIYISDIPSSENLELIQCQIDEILENRLNQ